MTNQQKFMAQALMILSGAFVSVQAQTPNSMPDPQTEKTATTTNSKKQEGDQRKHARYGKQVRQKQAKPQPNKDRETYKADETPSSSPIEYGGGGF